LKIAFEVCKIAFERKLARVPQPDDLLVFLQSSVYVPVYGDLVSHL